MTYQPQQKLFLIASIIPQTLSEQDAFRDLKELKDLVDAYGGKTVEFVIQYREIHDKGGYLGRGKIEEIAQVIKEHNIDVVVLNAVVKPGHIFDIKNHLQKQNPRIQVWDRVDLILQIFSQHAHTTEARLQIELAAMRHMGPRIYGMGYVLSRQGGSIGTRGIGETNTELMKRHWRTQMKKAQNRLCKLERDRQRQLERRKKMGFQTISLVGYTNAGKTSLFNMLTKKKNRVENTLFATLDASVGQIVLPASKKPILISDTIGFIRNLPTSLIDAFTSTLMESIHADLLLHVVDSSDEDIIRKIKAVENVLSDLHVAQKKTIFVFTKSDLLTKQQKIELTTKYSFYSPILISVKNKQGIHTLIKQIEDTITHEEKQPYSKKRIHFGWNSSFSQYSYEGTW